MNIKPAGKIAIVVLLVGGAYFLIRPMVGKKKPTTTEMEVKTDSVVSMEAESTVVAPSGLRHAPPVTKPVVKKQVTKPVVKPEAKKEVSKPKKKGERENLDINF
jgi:hypothetical protein